VTTPMKKEKADERREKEMRRQAFSPTRALKRKQKMFLREGYKPFQAFNKEKGGEKDKATRTIRDLKNSVG